MIIDKNKKYLIALDLDGTTLMEWDGVSDEKGRVINKVHQDTIDAIKRMQDDGHQFVICTGRNWFQSQLIYEMLSLNTYIINSAGAYIHNPSNKDLPEYKWGMDMNILNQIVSEDFIIGDAVGAIFDNDNRYHAHKDSEEKVKNWLANMNEPITIEDEIDFSPQSGMIFYNLEKELVEKKIEYLRERWGNEIHFIYWGSMGQFDSCIELNSAQNNKGSSFLMLAKELGFSKEQTMAFGDGENDLELMKMVEHPVGMKNSHKSILEHIKHQTNECNENGGVGKFLLDTFYR